MADIFIMPASTARLAAANAPPRFSPYDEVAALLIGWSADRGNHRGANLDRMKAFWEFWGYGVNVIYADTIPYEAASSGPSDLMPIPIARGGVKASECGVTNKFMQMLSGGIKPKGGWGEERRKLLIVGYHGHGGPQTTPFNGNRIWLYGSHNVRHIPLSFLQQYARDVVGATDVLFVRETCHGGLDGMHDLPTIRKDMTICETLAAGPGHKTISSYLGPNTYTARLVGTLHRNTRYGMEVRELHNLIQDPTIEAAPGFYKSHGLRTRSILLAPMRDSPAARAMAGQQVQVPRQLLPSPDAVVLSQNLSMEERAFLAGWSDEQKRKLLQLHRMRKSDLVICNEMNGLFSEAAIRQGAAGAATPYIIGTSIHCRLAITLLTRP